MREILFRGKRTDTGEWVYGDLIQLHDGRRFIIDNKFGACINNKGEFINTESPFVCECLPETIGQYTDLADYNGKCIFDGDIVKCRHHWQLRVYPREGIDEEKYFFAQKIRGAYGKSVDKENVFIPCERYYYFRNYAIEYFARNGEFRVRNGGVFHPLTMTYILNRNLEVIGNIHDNPELLKR